MEVVVASDSLMVFLWRRWRGPLRSVPPSSGAMFLRGCPRRVVGTVVERRVEDAAVVGSAGVSEMPFVRSHSTYKSTHM